MLISLLQLQCQ